MLRNIRRKEPRRIIDVLVGVLFVDLIALDFRGVLFAAQSANAASLGTSAPLTRFLHQSLNISCVVTVDTVSERACELGVKKFTIDYFKY